MLRHLTDDEFGDLLRSFRSTAFYFEAQETYALDYEAADMERFLAGSPQPPPEIGWWRPWLEQVSELTRQGKQVSRVRIISEPASDYQRWQTLVAPVAPARGRAHQLHAPERRDRGRPAAGLRLVATR